MSHRPEIGPAGCVAERIQGPTSPPTRRSRSVGLEAKSRPRTAPGGSAKNTLAVRPRKPR